MITIDRAVISSEKEAIRSALMIIEDRLEAAARRSGRMKSDIELLAVSKGQPLERMLAYQELILERGVMPHFGENYVQEFKEKREELCQGAVCHMIGRLQRNKAKDLVSLFDVVESVDSERIALALDKEAGRAAKSQAVFLQVNISDDKGKAGFPVNEIAPFLEKHVDKLKNLCFKGLMAITRFYERAQDARGDFAALRRLRDALISDRVVGDGKLLLSMGMSSDYEIAIEEGADVVRIGTALFGERKD